MTLQEEKVHKSDPNAPKWWEKSLIKRSCSSIDRFVATMVESSHFLQRSEELMNALPNGAILSLDRQNVLTDGILGKGSFSVVLNVQSIQMHDDEANRRVIQPGRFAIKHLRPDLIQSNSVDYFQEAAADLIVEAKYLAALNHPGILRLRGIAKRNAAAYMGGDYDSFFILTDRLDGTLKDRIQEYQCLSQQESLLECFRERNSHEEAKDNNPAFQEDCISFSERILEEKLDLALQLAQALSYLHEQNLIFRDLKPQNVGLIGNQVQLFDFGFCREMPSWSSSSSSSLLDASGSESDDPTYYMSGKGSLMYLAPEVLGVGKYNKKVDCYSFAMVLYELLSLNKPFHVAANINVFRELVCRRKAHPPLQYADIPDSLQDLLRHSWDHSIQDRWSMRQICDRLEDILHETRLQHSLSSSPPVNMASSEQPETTYGQQPAWEPPTSHCSGGEVLGMITDFCRDMRRAYDILTGQAAKVEPQTSLSVSSQDFMSSPIDSSWGSLSYSSLIPSRIDPEVLEEQAEERYELSCPTSETQESSLLSFGSIGILRRGPSSISSEEPLEMAVEPFSPQTPGATADTGEDRLELNVGAGDMDLRCPPSPPKRTISEPLTNNSTVKTMETWEDSAELRGPCPPVPLARRQSCTGAIVTETQPIAQWLPSRRTELRC